MSFASAKFENVAFVFVWQIATLSYVAMVQPSGGGGGAGDASAANQTTEIARLTSILGQLDVALSTRTKPADQQHVIVDSSSSIGVTGPLTDAQLRATAVPISGTVTSNAGTNLNTSALNLESTQALIKAKTDSLDVLLSTRLKPADTLTGVTTVGTITNVVHVDDNAGSLTVDGTVAIGAGSAVIGHVIADTGSTTAVTGNVTVVQPTGTNLHTVLDSGTLTSITNALPAGSNLLGKVGIDQTTPGTTNKVSVGSDVVHTIIDSGTTTVTQATGTNLHTVVDSGTVAISAGSAVIGHVIADTGSTTAVTGNVTVVQPTGTNLHAVLDSGTLSTITNVVHVDDNVGSLTVDNGGTFAVQDTEARPATATFSVVDFTSVSDSTHAMTFLAANGNRRGATIINASDTPIPIREGGTASSTAYTSVLYPGDTYVLDFPVSTALISGYFLTTPVGSVYVTERT